MRAGNNRPGRLEYTFDCFSTITMNIFLVLLAIHLVERSVVYCI